MKFGTVTGQAYGESVTLEQVNKNTAKKQFEAGERVWVNPCNMKVFNIWSTLTYVTKSDMIDDFETFYNSYVYYNCNNEMGKYPVFFKQLNNYDKETEGEKY